MVLDPKDDAFFFNMPYERAKPGSRPIFNKRLIVLASINFSDYRPLTEMLGKMRCIKVFLSVDEIKHKVEEMHMKLCLKKKCEKADIEIDIIIFEEAAWEKY